MELKYKVKNGIKYIEWEKVHRKAMRDPEFRKGYEALQPKYALIRAILNARIKEGMTQAEIAERTGTTQSSIARFEAGRGNPTLSFMIKIAHALGKRLILEVK